MRKLLLLNLSLIFCLLSFSSNININKALSPENKVSLISDLGHELVFELQFNQFKTEPHEANKE